MKHGIIRTPFDKRDRAGSPQIIPWRNGERATRARRVAVLPTPAGPASSTSRGEWSRRREADISDNRPHPVLEVTHHVAQRPAGIDDLRPCAAPVSLPNHSGPRANVIGRLVHLPSHGKLR